MRITLQVLGKAGANSLAFLLGQFNQIVFVQCCQYRQGRATSQRITAKGRAMHTGRKQFCRFAPRKTGSNRHAITQCFSQGANIRDNVVVLKGKKFTGTPNAALNFIQHHQQVVLVTQTAYLIKVIRGRYINAAFTLNGFNQNGNDIFIVCKRLFNGADIVVRYADKAFNQRRKALLYFAVSGRA